MGNYSLYCHTNLINGKQYIGLTKRNPFIRWGIGGIHYRKQKYFYKAIEKYGWNNFEHEILYTNLSRECASSLEKKLIKEFNTVKPSGYNLTLGGESSIEFTEEHRKNLSKSHLGYKIPESTKLKMSISRKGHHGYNCKPLWMCDKITHERIKYFNNSIEAKNYINSSDRRHITKVCRGKRKSAYGYFWEFDKDEVNE